MAVCICGGTHCLEGEGGQTCPRGGKTNQYGASAVEEGFDIGRGAGMSESEVNSLIRRLLDALRTEMDDLTPDMQRLFAVLIQMTPDPVPAAQPVSELGPEACQAGQEVGKISDPEASAPVTTHGTSETSAETTEEEVPAEPSNLSWDPRELTLERVPAGLVAQQGPPLSGVEPDETVSAPAEPSAADALMAERGEKPQDMDDAMAATDPELDAQQSANPAVVEDILEVPQLGCVPLRPAQASTQGEGATTPLEIVRKTVHLKNARINELYVGQIDVPGLKGMQLLDDGGTGLLLDNEAGTLSGRLGASGDFIVRVEGFLSGRRCDVVANLAVFPDPKSLWISKPHDPTAPFAKEDEDSSVNRGDLLCVAASKRGRSHAQEGLFRDDDFALWTGGVGGWNIAVVADGAGSAKYSRRGSQIAVQTIVQDLPPLLEEHLTGKIDGLVAEHRKGVEGADDRIKYRLYISLAKAALNAAVAISEEASKVEDRTSAFSTTLVISVARRVSYGWFVAGFSIGDGGAAVFDLRSRTVIPLTLADSGEFAGQTRFLHRGEFNNYDELTKRIFFDVRDSFTAVVAMTDGITDPKFPTESAFVSSDVWCRFWETDLSQSVVLDRDNPVIERELLAWLDFWSPGNHDDRTIAIMLS